MNAKSQNCQNCQNPAGWEKPWPFADEINLFRIPKEEQAAALKYEIQREYQRYLYEHHREEQSEAYWGEMCSVKPWLSRIDEIQTALVRAKTKPHRPPAARLATQREARDAFPNMDKTPALKLGRVATNSAREMVPFEISDDGLILALKIDPEQGREAIKTAVTKLLDQLEEIPSKSGQAKASDIEANLRGLAVLRAKQHSAKGANFMRHFSDTPYKGTVADQKTRLREIRKKLKWA